MRTWPASGTNGYAFSIRRPARYMGCWGPGTFVVTVLTERLWRARSRRGRRARTASAGRTRRARSASSRPRPARSRLRPSIWARTAPGARPGPRCRPAGRRTSPRPCCCRCRARPACAPTRAPWCCTTRPSTDSPRETQQVAEAARDHGEHDVVDAAAMLVADRLDVRQPAARPCPAAVRPDRAVERRVLRRGAAALRKLDDGRVAIGRRPRRQRARVADRRRRGRARPSSGSTACAASAEPMAAGVLGAGAGATAAPPPGGASRSASSRDAHAGRWRRRRRPSRGGPC